MAKFEIVLLGTGSPLPSANRCGVGTVVIGEQGSVLIDCGWGVARRLLAAGISPKTIDHVFFTHMHSDHITDFPDFMMLRWTLGASTTPLTVFGPEATREVVEGFRQALNPDVRYRMAHHGEKVSLDGMECIVHEIPATAQPANHVTVGDLTVSSFEVDHRPVVPALGFKVVCSERAVVFSGDTKRVQSLTDAAKGADVLVSEAVNLSMIGDRIKMLRAAGDERNAQMLTEAADYHLPTMDLAATAREAGVKRVVISHIIPPIPDDGPVAEQYVAGMSDVFTGEITLGRDLQRIVVEA